MGLPQPEGYLFWYTTSAILGLLTLINIISITIRYIARRSGSTLPLLESAPSSPDHSSRSGSLSEKDPENIRITRQLSKAQRFSRAFTLCADKFIGLSTIPLPRLRWWIKRKPGKSIATTEFIWTFVYTLGCLVLTFTGSELLYIRYRTSLISSRCTGPQNLCESGRMDFRSSNAINNSFGWKKQLDLL